MRNRGYENIGAFMDEPAPIRARIRRWYIPNAIYFITAVTWQRDPLFADSTAIAILRSTLHRVQEKHPFRMIAYAFMPDHMHLLIHVPESSDITAIMHSAQRNFTWNYKHANGIEESLHLWQRGFWDHVIRDERDLEMHMNDVHYNPVKHGLAAAPGDYAHTSFAEYVRRGWYDASWNLESSPVLPAAAE